MPAPNWSPIEPCNLTLSYFKRAPFKWCSEERLIRDKNNHVVVGYLTKIFEEEGLQLVELWNSAYATWLMVKPDHEYRKPD